MPSDLEAGGGGSDAPRVLCVSREMGNRQVVCTSRSPRRVMRGRGEEREEEDSRRWEPPEEGEEFVEPDPELRRIEPGSLPTYQRGISMLPDLED